MSTKKTTSPSSAAKPRTKATSTVDAWDFQPFATPEELHSAIQAYNKYCTDKGQLPSFPGMKMYLHIVTDDDMDYYVGESNPQAEEFRRVFAWQALYREHYLLNESVTDPKKATACMNALKQMENGGYKDKATGNSETKLLIRMDNAGKGAFD